MEFTWYTISVIHPLMFCTGIVTRCPLELKMIRTKGEGKWQGKISYQDYEEDIDDPAEVEKKIREGKKMLRMHLVVNIRYIS